MSESPFEAPSIESLQALFPAYRFDALIAQGGMGAVYRAHQLSLERDVAVKILPRELGEDPEFRRSFLTEARAMARLNHPNLIAVYDSGDVEGLPYIVMEYVPGNSLFHSSHGRKVDPGQAVELVTGICHGLAHAHEQGVIHRDIKPANILLTPKLVPKIGDFGLAVNAEGGEGLAMATPDYTAPEVFEDPASAGVRSDLFSVGVILYELLTGSLPGPDAPPPSALGDADAALDGIWRRATDPDPGRRYADAGDLLADLESWSVAPGDSAWEREMVETEAAPAAGSGSGLRAIVRNVAIIAILLVAIGVTWDKLKQTEAERSATNEEVAATNEEARERARKESALQAEAARKEAAERAAAADESEAASEESSPPDEPATAMAGEADVPEAQEEDPAESATAGGETAGGETPAQSLRRLREDLAAGERDEFPVSTTKTGSSAYFFVNSAMPWDTARRFAESYGGHLALISGAADARRLAGDIPPDAKASASWVAATGRDGHWVQLDGTALPEAVRPAGEGARAVVRAGGSLAAEPDTAKRPFFIEWRLDGSNPCDLAAVLARTRESLDTAGPEFPPGTITRDGRHYLLARREAVPGEARELAETGGAHLMVPSDEAEAEWIASRIAEVDPPTPLLIGATREELVWRWDTGERWTFARWAADVSEGEGGGGGAALAIDDAGRWVKHDSINPAPGFILEWGDPEPASGDATGASGAEPMTIAELRQRAAGLLADLDETRRKELVENEETFAWNLDVWLRGNSNGNIARWTPSVERLKKRVESHRVPSNLPEKPTGRFPERMLEIARHHLKQQQRIDADFEQRATAIRDAYLERLGPLIEQERARGQIDLAAAFTERRAAAADLDQWLGGFDEVEETTEPSLSRIRVNHAVYGARGNDADVTEKVRDYIEKKEESFRVLVRAFGIDPDPGWNKGVTIEYEIGVETYKEWFGRNSVVSPEILFKRAGVDPEED